MKKLLFILFLIIFPIQSNAQTGLSNGAIFVGNSPVLGTCNSNQDIYNNNGLIGCTLRPIKPQDFGAICNGTAADDTIPLSNWLTAINNGASGYVQGNCTTTLPMSFFPSSSSGFIHGDGFGKSKITYTGSTTTGDIFTIGTTASNHNSIQISGIDFESNTIMTSGACLHVMHEVNGGLRDVMVGANTNNCYIGYWDDDNGFWLIDGQWYFNGSAEGVRVSGQTSPGSPGDVTISGFGQIANGNGIGLHIAGGVNGFSMLAGDILVNAQNVKIDKSIITTQDNQELFFAPRGVFVDIQKTGATAPNFEVVAGGSQIQDFIQMPGWIASSSNSQPCVQFDVGFTGIVQFPSDGYVTNCNGDGVNINSTSASIYADGLFQNNGGYGINNSGADPNLWVKPTASFNGNSSGDINGVGGAWSIVVTNFGGTSVSNGILTNIASKTLPANGKWQCFGSGVTIPAGTTTTSYFEAGLSPTSATLTFGDMGSVQSGASISAGLQESLNFGPAFYSGGQTVYLVEQINFAVSTMKGGGAIRCVRYE